MLQNIVPARHLQVPILKVRRSRTILRRQKMSTSCRMSFPKRPSWRRRRRHRRRRRRWSHLSRSFTRLEDTSQWSASLQKLCKLCFGSFLCSIFSYLASLVQFNTSAYCIFTSRVGMHLLVGPDLRHSTYEGKGKKGGRRKAQHPPGFEPTTSGVLLQCHSYSHCPN